MTIYLDVVFIENMCMNYIILFATAIITKIKVKHWKILISSVIGSIYAVILTLQLLEIYSNFFLKIILSITMVYIALEPKNIKNLLKQLIIFYLTSFTFGGVAFALLYFVRPQDILMKNGVYIGSYPIKIALLGGVVGFVIITTAFKLIKNRMTKKDMFCEIQINFNEKAVNVKALVDSGHFLKEPITGLPVIVIESKELQDILPETILENVEDILQGNKTEVLSKEEYIIYKFRLIPFTSLGKQNGLLLGFKPDNVIIKTDENERKLNNSVIGIYTKNLTKDNLYNALISLDIIEGSDKNEHIKAIKV